MVNTQKQFPKRRPALKKRAHSLRDYVGKSALKVLSYPAHLTLDVLLKVKTLYKEIRKDSMPHKKRAKVLKWPASGGEIAGPSSNLLAGINHVTVCSDGVARMVHSGSAVRVSEWVAARVEKISDGHSVDKPIGSPVKKTPVKETPKPTIETATIFVDRLVTQSGFRWSDAQTIEYLRGQFVRPDVGLASLFDHQSANPNDLRMQDLFLALGRIITKRAVSVKISSGFVNALAEIATGSSSETFCTAILNRLERDFRLGTEIDIESFVNDFSCLRFFPDPPGRFSDIVVDMIWRLLETDEEKSQFASKMSHFIWDTLIGKESVKVRRGVIVGLQDRIMALPPVDPNRSDRVRVRNAFKTRLGVFLGSI